MRTTEEIMEEILRLQPVSVEIEKDEVMTCMRQYAKEVLIEAAERAKSEWVRWGEHMGHAVDKESILALIDELK
jgi:hypothetical protein